MSMLQNLESKCKKRSCRGVGGCHAFGVRQCFGFRGIAASVMIRGEAVAAEATRDTRLTASG